MPNLTNRQLTARLATIEAEHKTILDFIAIASGGGTGLMIITSSPPPGCYKIVNIYVDADGKFIAKWSDTPQG